ncbi:hypothetical protein [Dyella sp.]
MHAKGIPSLEETVQQAAAFGQQRMDEQLAREQSRGGTRTMG